MQNWITARGVPVHDHRRSDLRQRQLRGGDRQGDGLFDYDGLRREQADRRDRNDPVQLGIGISTFTEMCGLAPCRVLGSLSYGAGGWESASIRMLPTGKVEVVTGTTPHGQGHVTSWSQIAADALGVPFEDVEVIYGDTDFAPQGHGHLRVPLAGRRRRRGPPGREKVVEKARRIAAHLLEAAEADVEFANGAFSVKGSPEASMTIQDVALATFAGAQPAGRHGADAELRLRLRPGELLLPARHPPVRRGGRHRDRALEDPQVRRGRRHRQGGQPADRRGAGARRPRPGHRAGAVRGGGLRRRRQPRHRDHGRLPGPERGRPDPFVTDRTETPATSNPLGVKGVGEAGTIASTPAVVNAVVDALRPQGVNDIRMPASPDRVWRALQTARNDGGAR